jgi:acyl-CoA thioester hydrolase
MTKTPEKTVQIRFPDCDPFNHLNNARYLDYFMNAREDHAAENYEFHPYRYAAKTGRNWVVKQNQIAYLKPAFLGEHVVIQSVIREIRERQTLVEMFMYNQDKSQVKSLLWATLTFVDLKTGKSIPHTDDVLEIFEPLVLPFEHQVTFSERVAEFKKNR